MGSVILAYPASAKNKARISSEAEHDREQPRRFSDPNADAKTRP
jgi:hypothetical protein